MSGDELSSLSQWSREQDKQFEKALATYPEKSKDRWEKIASDVAGKSVEEVKHHYELLVDDVSRIESGYLEVPCYNSSSDGSIADEATRRKGGHSGHLNSESNHGGKGGSKTDQERRKGIAWTEDEHRLLVFLLINIFLM